MTTRQIVRSVLATTAGVGIGVWYYAIDMVGMGGAVVLSAAGGFVGFAFILPSVSIGGVIDAGAGFFLGLTPGPSPMQAPDPPQPAIPPPFAAPPVPEVDPRWRTLDVLGLARGIVEDGDWDRLPLLADALTDAGCDDEEHLAACRRPGLTCAAYHLVIGLLGETGTADLVPGPNRRSIRNVRAVEAALKLAEADPSCPPFTDVGAVYTMDSGRTWIVHLALEPFDLGNGRKMYQDPGTLTAIVNAETGQASWV